jgi:hypothetical protein
MSTVISPRGNPGGRTNPNNDDERIPAVNEEFDRRAEEEVIVSDDDEPEGYIIVTNNTPESGDPQPDFARKGTLALERVAAGWAKRDRLAREKEQELDITSDDLKKILNALGDHQDLIQRQKYLIEQQERRLMASDRADLRRRSDVTGRSNSRRHIEGLDRHMLDSRKRRPSPPRREPPSVATKYGRSSNVFDRLGREITAGRETRGRGQTCPPFP